MGLTLAAMLGRSGFPAAVSGYGYGSDEPAGSAAGALSACRASAGRQSASDASSRWRRSATCCCIPGEAFDYNGRRLTYPDIRLVYWAGGNPFHHHQDIPRLRRALGRVDTIVVHDPYWTAMAKHADIVVPSTTALERYDYPVRATTAVDAMPKLAEPSAVAGRLHDICSTGRALGFGDQFTEGRTARSGCRIYTTNGAAGLAFACLTFDEFWRAGSCGSHRDRPSAVLLARFSADPERARLNTPSGRIEIFSSTSTAFITTTAPGIPSGTNRWNGSDRPRPSGSRSS